MLGSVSAATPDQDVPRGTLNVDRDLVREGMHSKLDWKIEYPKKDIIDIVDIDPKGTIKPKKDLTMKVRVLGVAFQSGSKLLPLDAYWSINGSSWTNFFYGRGPDVEPGKVLFQKKVTAGSHINFGARGYSGRRWNPFHSTGTGDTYVTVLKNRDTPPDYAPAYDQGDIESYMGPYMDAYGKVRIGDRDLLVLWEASTSRPGSRYFDMQDLVVLLTFE